MPTDDADEDCSAGRSDEHSSTHNLEGNKSSSSVTPTTLDELLATVGDNPLSDKADVQRVAGEADRRPLLEAAARAEGFRAIKAHCNDTYDATFDSARSTVLEVHGPGDLSQLVSFQARVPNSPFADERTDLGIVVLFTNDTPTQVVGVKETHTAAEHTESILLVEDGAVVERSDS